MSSAPGFWESSATTELATQMLRPARTTPATHPSPRPLAPSRWCSNALPATAGWLTPATSGPSAHSKPRPVPGATTTSSRLVAKPTARPYGRWPTGWWASSTPASSIASPTVKKSPGHLWRPPLDFLHTWDVYGQVEWLIHAPLPETVRESVG